MSKPDYRPLALYPLALALVLPALADVAGVEAWAYQLQDLSVAQVVANTTFDLIVMDPSSDGSIAGEWSADEIQQIAASGKLPLAYLSIGEAEDYRWYWQPSWNTNPPGWLGPENPDWPGNYKVRFWVPAWQSLVLQSLQRIVAQGFVGVYLDVVDAYYFWSEEQQVRPQADADMVHFVRTLADSLRAWGGAGQLVVPQNGEFLPIEDDVAGQLDDLWWETIDAIGVEDVFCPGEANENNPFAPDTERLAMLAAYRQHSKTVLSVDYLTQPALISQYRQAALNADFLPYATERALDQLHDGMGETGLGGPPRAPTAGAIVTAEHGILRLRLERPVAGPLEVRLYDLCGRLATAITLAPARSSLSWRPVGLPAGRYFCLVRDRTGWQAVSPVSWLP